jgi:uncharacterized protein involved in exopolysaccharide biosynthesis
MRRPDDELDDLLGGSGQSVARPGLPVDPGRLWLSVKRDWRWIPFAGAIWLALGLVVAFVFIKHTFKAEAILIWEPQGEGRPDERQLATQAGSMKLPGALRQVKETLKLPVSIETLARQIDVYFDARSNLVTIEAAGPSRADSMKLANGVIAVFLEQQREITKARAGDATTALESDVATARERLQRAVTAYDAFRTEHGIADIEHEKQLAIDNVARLKQEQQTARAEASALEARAAGLESAFKKQGKTTVQSASSSNPEAGRLAELKSELATARARYSADHPRLAMLESQVSALEQRTSKSSTVVSNVTTGLNPEYQSLQSGISSTRAEQEAALKRDKSYDQFVQAAEQRVATLSALEGKARSLLQDVKLVEERLSDVETQLSQARDAARSPQIEWRVLTPAMEPEWPERSKRRLIVAGMPIAGMLLALLVLLIRPLLDGRVYTAREAGYWANLPVIGSSAWPRSREMFFTLVDELGDQGVGAGGYTLVLGATGREKALAEELAYWLGGGAVANRREHQQNNVTRMEVAMATPAPKSAAGASASTADTIVAEAPFVSSAGGGGSSSSPVHPSEALVPVQRQGAAISLYPQGTHAWLGANEGPALRRAARMADRVILLLSSGTEAFTNVVDLRTRLGRDKGVGVVLLGLSPELLKLPDRVGDVDGFWRYTHVRPGN